jgi:hypothetical protein
MPESVSNQGPKLSAHFFRRERDGSVRLRIRFTPEEAALIEEAAGDTPLLLYIHRVLRHMAHQHIERARSQPGYQPFTDEPEYE